MKMNLYACKDKTGEHFLPLMQKRSDADAVRDFQHSVNHPESILHNHPEDFELWCLGSYDDETGNLSEEKRVVVSAVAVFHKDGKNGES